MTLAELFGGETRSNIVEFTNRVKQHGIRPQDIERLYEALMLQDGIIDVARLQAKFDRLE